MKYLVRFGEYYTIVKADSKEQAQEFLGDSYSLSPDEYGITEANDDDVKFVENNGGRILVADPESSSPIYKEANGN